MHVQVNTDGNVAGSEDLTRRVAGVVEGTLGRFGDRVTRVEVHLNDVNGRKAGHDDNRCQIEARLAGLQPISVSHQAGTLEEALDGAVKKLQRSLDSTLGKLGGR
jgi:ribosome-associated translation inhibitor RaiA